MISKLRRQLNYVLLVNNLLNRQHPPQLLYGPGQADRPWKRLHVDFAGPYLGKTFLVVVDAYSKFLEIVAMTRATSTNAITALRHIFSYFGLPEHLVTDNGTQFKSDEFQKFLRENDILHTLTAPGHPASRTLCG